MIELMDRAAYLPFVALTAIGIYLMLAHRNFIKALVGLQVFQTAIILFFIVLAVRTDGTIPIMNELHGDEHHAATASASEGEGRGEGLTVTTAPEGSDHGGDHHSNAPSPNPSLEGRGAEVAHDAKTGHHYDSHTVMHNPLPHALMLTAIVVGVATQGVGLAILRRIKDETGSIEDTESEVA